MSIFRVQSKKVLDKGTRFVGVQLPQQLSSFLSLYSIANGSTKTAVLSDIVEAWVKQQQKLTNEESLIVKLIARAKVELDSRKTKGVKGPYSATNLLSTELRKELKRKGFTTALIDRIINELKDAEN
jgi:hypothetical protein